MRSKRDQYMDELATKVGEVLDGVNLLDTIAICCALISLAIKDIPPESRAEVRRLMNSFMDKIDQE